MTAAPPLISVELTRTQTSTLYWDVEAATPLDGSVYLAFVDPQEYPGSTTVWTAGTWASNEVVTGEGTPQERHYRTVSLLTAGPDGLMSGSPRVVQSGEWDTYVRVVSSSERDEIRAQMLIVWP